MIVQLIYILIFIHLVPTKQPFTLTMNPVNSRVRKPVIRLCNILWWLHQALHHWLDYRGSGFLTHTTSAPAYTHTASHFKALYSVEKSSCVCLMNSAHLVERIINSGINVVFMFMSLRPVSESKMSMRCVCGKTLPVCFGRLWMWGYTKFN